MLRRRHVIAIAAFLAVAAGACKKSGPTPPKGNIAENLALPVLGGGVFDPGELAGKRVLLNFWRPG